MIAYSPAKDTDNFHANIEAEEEILGAILTNDKAIELATNSLSIEAFSLAQHQTIFNACIRCYKANQTTDLMAVALWLKDNNQLDNVGGQAKLAQLVDRSGTTHISTAIEIVLREYWRRKLNSLTAQIQGLTSDRTQKIEEIIGRAESEILSFNAAFSRSSTSFYRTKIKLDGDLKESVESLLEASNDTLEIAEIYPYGGLGNALVQKARNLPIAPECLHQTLIGVCAGILGTRARVEIHPGWTEPAVIFSGFVGEPGSKKSPAVSSVLKPLVELQEQDFLEFQNNELSYQVASIEWDALKKDEKAQRLHEGEAPPERPLMRHRYVRNLTVETVIALHAEKPSLTGFPAIYDELAEFFFQLNQYKGGKGSDRQVVLQWWNASDIKVDRKSKDSSVFMAKSAISITGAIQYSVLAGLMGDKEDGDGMWGRFLWSCPKYIRSDRRSRSIVDISGLLKTLYKKLDSFPEMTYKLSPEAYDLLLWYESHIEDRRETASTALRNTYAKLIGYAARLALVLHCIDLAMGKEAAFDIVDADAMARAIGLCFYYEGQSRWLHAQILGSNGEISAELARIIAEYEDRGEVDSSILRNRKFGNASQCKEWLRELAILGYGQVMPAGKGKLKFTFFPPGKTGKQEVDEKPDAKGSSPYVESISGDDEKISRFHEENIFNEESSFQPSPVDVPGPEENVEIPSGCENLPRLVETDAEQKVQPSDEVPANFPLSVGDKVILNTPGLKSHLAMATITSIKNQIIFAEPEGVNGSISYELKEILPLPQPVYGCGNRANQGDRVKDPSRGKNNRGVNLFMDCTKRGSPKEPFWVWSVKVRWNDGSESFEQIEFLELDNDDDNDGITTEPDDGGSAISFPPEQLEEFRQYVSRVSANYDKYSKVATNIEDNAPSSAQADLKAISLWQPFASLCAIVNPETGKVFKRFETRSWGTDYRGKLIIHAAKKDDKYQQHLTKEIAEKLGIDLSNLPLGCAIAECDLVDCIEMSKDFIASQSELEIYLGDWSVGRFAWKLENVRPIKPTPLIGHQGLWNVERDLIPTHTENSIVDTSRFTPGDKVRHKNSGATGIISTYQRFKNCVEVKWDSWVFKKYQESCTHPTNIEFFSNFREALTARFKEGEVISLKALKHPDHHGIYTKPSKNSGRVENIVKKGKKFFAVVQTKDGIIPFNLEAIMELKDG